MRKALTTGFSRTDIFVGPPRIELGLPPPEDGVLPLYYAPKMIVIVPHDPKTSKK